jgi:hypothetical protein
MEGKMTTTIAAQHIEYLTDCIITALGRLRATGTMAHIAGDTAMVRAVVLELEKIDRKSTLAGRRLKVKQ